MANYLTFAEIIDAVEKSVKQYKSSMQALVKSVINQVYLNEVLQCDNLYPLNWLHFPIMEKLHAPKTITAITAATPPVVTCASHGFVNGEIISIWDVAGMTEVNYDYNAYLSNIKLYVVADKAANTFELTDLWGTDVVGLGFTAYTSGGTILHHGWSVPAPVSGLVRTVTGMSIHDGLPLTNISWKELFESPDTWLSSSSGTPSRFMHFQSFTAAGTALNYVLNFPGAQETKMAYLMIEATGNRLVANGDVPLLPPQFHDTIVAGAITRLAENNVQVENAVIWPGIYTNQLEAIKTYNRKWWKQHEGELNSAPYLL